jgi:pimeloyl-ACP methyl ester carboxylesterase
MSSSVQGGAGWTRADDPRVERKTRLRHLLARFDILQIECAHIVSHGMGVITAWQLTYGHPERVRTAVQLAVPPAFMKLSPRSLPGFRHLPPLYLAPPRRLTAHSLFRIVRRHPMAETVVEAHLAQMRRPDIDGAVRPLTRHTILPEAARLASGVYSRRRLTVPTLVILGRRDRPLIHRILLA